jgi:glycosyltransferase involved in cell wall biosynthesis
MNVSVVIPCRDAAGHLGTLLESLATDLPVASWEVLVIDNGSHDDTPAVARSWADRLPVRTITATGRRSPAFARNQGASDARGEHLVFLDADDAVAPGYVDAMHRALASADLVASRPETARLNPGWVARSRPLGVDDGLNHSLAFLPFAASACLGIRRDVFAALGGFSDLRTCEDIDLCWRAQLAGHALAPAPGAVLHYRLRPTVPAIARQAFGYGRSMPLLYRRFAAHGMPRPSATQAWDAWLTAARRVATRDRARRAEGMYLLGLAAGRLAGSIRHRVRYL